MKSKGKHLLIVFVAVVALAVMLALPGRSQNMSTPHMEADTTRELSATSAAPAKDETRGVRLTGATRSAGFASAAMRNTALRTDLVWAFGGKQQRGWYLYESLIGQLLGVDHDVASGDFAETLARWQNKMGIAPSGVLDGETLSRMVSFWQGQRLKDRTYPTSAEVVLAPPSDFYDPSRPDALRHVEREAYVAYKRMVAAAAADPSLKLAVTPGGELAASEKYLKIVSAFRSKEYQEQLRRQSPNSGRAGLAVNSPHFTGRALDIYVGGEPVSTKDENRAIQVQTPVYKWLVKNAARFGFRPYYYEPWHWEYVGQ